MMEPGKFPCTKRQKRARRKEFIQAISVDHVCCLASNYRSGQPCHVFQDVTHGSFNACFFIEFDDQTRWVVRFPLENSVFDPWQKILNEVATLRYLEKNTKIPVAHVHAFGPRGPPDTENPTGLAFLIVDYLAGRPIDLPSFRKKSWDERAPFYGQLTDILAELHAQTFPHAGSLTLDPDDLDGPPIVGPLASMSINELRVPYGKDVIESSTFSSAADYAFNQFRVLDKLYQEAYPEMEFTDCQREEFALACTKEHMIDMLRPETNHGPFVLSHTDLRWANIIVDDDMAIQGIVDWEWSCVVPQQFFLPPFWIGGTSLEEVGGTLFRVEYDMVWFPIIKKKVEEAASESCGALMEIWPRGDSKTLPFIMAFLLQHPQFFTDLFCLGIFPKFYEGKIETVVEQFFKLHGDAGPYAANAQARYDRAKAYKQYLSDNGLVWDDENIA